MNRALIAAQVAFCFLVLFVAGLFVAHLQRLSHQPLGFSPERILALDVVTQDSQATAFWRHVQAILQSAPGVEKTATADFALLSGTWWNNPIAINGPYSGHEFSNFLSVSPGWFDTMRIPLLAGRDFRGDETYPDKVAIVNRDFVERFFKSAERSFKAEDAVGRTFSAPIPSVAAQAKITIVGLVENARYGNLRDPIPPVVYFPSNSAPSPAITMMVRTASPNSLALVPTLRTAISAAAPGLRLSSVRTQQELIDNQTVRERLLAMLAAFFAAVALLLAAVGLYGVLDYSVFQRRREIGIRMAVGARASHIVRGVTIGLLAWVLAGSAAGLALGLASTRYIESLLYQVKATDPSSLAIPALALLAATILASLPPVLRAVRIDPVQTLRLE